MESITLYFPTRRGRDIISNYLLNRGHTINLTYSHIDEKGVKYAIKVTFSPTSIVHAPKEFKNRHDTYRNIYMTTQLESVKESYGKILREMWVNI